MALLAENDLQKTITEAVIDEDSHFTQLVVKPLLEVIFRLHHIKHSHGGWYFGMITGS